MWPQPDDNIDANMAITNDQCPLPNIYGVFRLFKWIS